jgi:RND family efflux transporter MFP subunit
VCVGKAHAVRTVGLALAVLLGCQRGEAPDAGFNGPLAVRVVSAQEQSVPNRFGFIGSVEAIQRVELRARVRGFITEIGFEEGAVVQHGQLLFKVDARPYRAAARAATAALRQNEALLAEARSQLRREQKLREQGVNSVEQLETAQARVASLSAQVSEQRAAVEQARLDVVYSELRAPFTGRVGERLVDLGTLVGESDATLLAVLVQEDPVFVQFSPTERERMEMVRLAPELEHAVDRGELPVRVTLADGRPHPHLGKLTFVDNAVDPTTRTLTFKATVLNPERRLKPGQSVNVELELPASPRLLVPSVAIASVQDIDYVHVVDDENIARYREVELGRTIGRQRVVLSGLEPGEQVVVGGLHRINEGMRVDPEQTPAARAQTAVRSPAVERG